MNSVNSIDAGGSTAASSALTDQALTMLQAQIVQYMSASGIPPSSVDYKAFQYAVDTGNLVSAQAALTRLRRDNLPEAATAAAQQNAPAQTSGQPAVSEAAPTDSSGGDGNSLDATA